MSSDPQKYSEHNLIVNFVPQNYSDEDFKNLFSSIGPIKASRIIRDKETGVSFGFGFVEYLNESDSLKAIESLDGLQLQSKRIKVAYARQGEKGANVYVRYLPKSMSSKDLETLFSGFGEIISARVLTDQNTGLSRGVGFVLFSSREYATAAVAETNGKAPPGCTQALAVKFAEDNKTQKMQKHAAMMGGLPASPYSYGSTMPTGMQLPPGIPIPPRMQGMPSVRGIAGPGMSRPGMPRPGMPRLQNPGGNTFGADYQGMYGGGPLRSSGGNQRFNPMSSYSPMGADVGLAGNGREEYVLFVYNIGTDTEEHGLWKLFSAYGAIKKVAVVKENEKKPGKRFGFVTMFDYQEAMCAIQQLNGTVFADNIIQVSLKKPKA